MAEPTDDAMGNDTATTTESPSLATHPITEPAIDHHEEEETQQRALDGLHQDTSSDEITEPDNHNLASSSAQPHQVALDNPPPLPTEQHEPSWTEPSRDLVSIETELMNANLLNSMDKSPEEEEDGLFVSERETSPSRGVNQPWVNTVDSTADDIKFFGQDDDQSDQDTVLERVNSINHMPEGDGILVSQNEGIPGQEFNPTRLDPTSYTLEGVEPFVAQNEPLPAHDPCQSTASASRPRPATPRINGSLIKKIQSKQAFAAKRKDLSTRGVPAASPAKRVDPNKDFTNLNAATQGRLPTPYAPTPVETDNDVVSDRKARAVFEAQKRKYETLRAAQSGNLNFRQDIEWMKIKSAEEARRRKRNRELAKAREDMQTEGEAVFPTPPDSVWSELPASNDLDLRRDGTRKRAGHNFSQNSPKPISIVNAELQSMQVGMEAADESPRKKAKKTSKTPDEATASSSRGKAANSRIRSKPASKKGPQKATKASRKQAVILEKALAQGQSLFGSNVFMQQAGPDAAEQPELNSRRKADALKELIASLPTDRDHEAARGEMNNLLNATKQFDGRGSVKAVPGSHTWMVKGMKTALKHYQVLGSAFMRRRENSVQEPRGGLLADQMGLGKTLMMLANIVNGQPPRNTREPKTTLIVASPSLLTQWGSEIEQHTECGLQVMRYGPGTRIHTTDASNILSRHDIILTTYSEVMRSYPKNDPPIECQTVEQKSAWWKKTFEEHRGILHRLEFLRVVLDEAQIIKNHLGRTSIACRALMARHRWALSGTPILNSLTELYPYFKFLGVPYTGSFKIFKSNYCSSDRETQQRLMLRLADFMMRRTHEDKMFGAPILKLPQADQGTHWCEFNRVERCIYDIVHARFTARLNMWSKADKLDKSYSNAMVMLLRLRQLTSHILMLQLVMRDLLEREDIERIKRMAEDESADTSTASGKTIVAVRKQLEEHERLMRRKNMARKKAKEEAEAAGKEYHDDLASDDEIETEDEEEMTASDNRDITQSGQQLVGHGKAFGTCFDFKPYLRGLETGEIWEKIKARSKCGSCDKKPQNPWLTSCGHLICEAPCLDNANIEAAENGQDQPACKVCGTIPTSIVPCNSEENSTESVAQSTRAQTKKKKNRQQPSPEHEALKENWLEHPDILPSAKTIALKAQILNWIKENPQIKIIVYTQFLAMIQILDKICKDEGWKVAKYHGKMSLSARDKAIESFGNGPGMQIMLASLRCGGLGLNLTMASKVIMLDPWWNSASEQQAFCRVFRIGQENETFMSRICVKRTIDEKLIKMQKRKDDEIKSVMEHDGKKVPRLSYNDLMKLFGHINEDTGKPFILADDIDRRGGFRAGRDDEDYADEM